MKQKKITVTREHWDRGVAAVLAPNNPGLSRCCVLAQALHDAGYPDASVGYTTLRLGDDATDQIIPLVAHDLRELFDRRSFREAPHEPDGIEFPVVFEVAL